MAASLCACLARRLFSPRAFLVMYVMSGFSHATTMDDEIYIAGLRSVGCTQLFRQPYKMVNLQVSAYTLAIGSDFRCSRSNSTGTSGGTMFSTCPRGNSNLTLGCDWVIHSNDFKNRHICGWETNKINASCSLFPLSHSKYSLTHSLFNSHTHYQLLLHIYCKPNTATVTSFSCFYGDKVQSVSRDSLTSVLFTWSSDFQAQAALS